MSYHAVHCKVVVLGLQLDGMLVVPSDLCVTGEKKPLVVHDPIEHLYTGPREENVLSLTECTTNRNVNYCSAKELFKTFDHLSQH